MYNYPQNDIVNHLVSENIILICSCQLTKIPVTVVILPYKYLFMYLQLCTELYCISPFISEHNFILHNLTKLAVKIMFL